MIKIRIISLFRRSKTNALGKTFFSIGCLLLLIFILLSIVPAYRNESGIILAFSILFLAVGGIFYFFYLQFMKLEKIAQEFEQENTNESAE